MQRASDTPLSLQARNLSYATAGGHVLVQGVSFDLGQGTTLAIDGPNGAGKTTLLHLLSG